MNKELLKLKPKRYLCPICGEWHEWLHSEPLGNYDYDIPAKFSDKNLYPKECAMEYYTVYVEEGKLYYSTDKMCGRALLNLDGEISIDDIRQEDDRPIVSFYVDFTSYKSISRDICYECRFKDECNLLKLDQGDHRSMKIPLGFEFEQSEYDKVTKKVRRTRKKLNRSAIQALQTSSNIRQSNQ